MKQTQEFEGKNIEKAIEAACKKLNITKKILSYDVISTGSSGIFGIVGTKKAKIRVTLPEKIIQQNKEDITSEEFDGVMSIVDEAFGEKKKLKKNFDEIKEKKVLPKNENKVSLINKEFKKNEILINVPEEFLTLAIKTLQKIIDSITDGATVVATTKNNNLLLKIEGGNSGVLIGRRGQTIEAMQFLIEKIINRKSEARIKLKIDIKEYMMTRKANLKSLARKMADKVRKTGKSTTINQMTSQDRRIIHLTLKDDIRIKTQSMGDGYYKKLIIFPKKNNYKKNTTYKKT
ncbi:MAG: RNA-binding protein [Desulfobacteraceae bacterium 4572_130]|nr:MAG: RNA-binding protein [Desulfobacteraceae bacterium 4572_130]